MGTKTEISDFGASHGVTNILHCIWCGAFVIRPSSDRCSCGAELHPVSFNAEDGMRFWPTEGTESRLTEIEPVVAIQNSTQEKQVETKVVHRQTVTEALAEIKTLAKRIKKKEEFVCSYLVRPDVVRDPHDEGSDVVVGREIQAISDLRSRWVALRCGIAAVNAETELELHGVNRTVAEWLVWRREVANGEVGLVERMRSLIASLKKQVEAQSTEDRPIVPVVSVDETWLFRQEERLAQMLGELDGRLSLLNATTFVSVEA